jgi:hypothetical protein
MGKVSGELLRVGKLTQIDIPNTNSPTRELFAFLPQRTRPTDAFLKKSNNEVELESDVLFF